jgi:hypothetical protein
VGAHQLAVLAGEDDDRAVRETQLREFGHDAADHLVDERDLAPVARLHLLQVARGVHDPPVAAGRVFLEHVAQHARPLQHGRIEGLVEGGGHLHLPRVVHPVVDAVEGRVGVEEAQEYRERAVAVALDELDALAGHVGRLAQVLGQGIRVAARIAAVVVVRLDAAGGQEVVVPRARRAVAAGGVVLLVPVLGALERVEAALPEDLVAQVPLAEPGGAVGGRRQHLDEDAPVRGERRVVEAGPVRVRIEARQEARARGRAERLGHVGALEQHAAPRQRVEVRRADQRVAVRAHRVAPVLVGEDEQQVRRPFGGRSGLRRAAGQHHQENARRRGSGHGQPTPFWCVADSDTIATAARGGKRVLPPPDH